MTSGFPRGLVEGTAGVLKRTGFEVQLKIYDDEDHYLLFSQPEAVLDDILEWMKAESGNDPLSRVGIQVARPLTNDRCSLRLRGEFGSVRVQSLSAEEDLSMQRTDARRVDALSDR